MQTFCSPGLILQHYSRLLVPIVFIGWVQTLGSCNLSKKKKRSKWNKPFGFSLGTAISFFSGSLKNLCSLEKRIFTLRFFGFTLRFFEFTSLWFLLYFGITLRFFHTIICQGFGFRDSVYEIVWGRLRSEKTNPLKPNPLKRNLG